METLPSAAFGSDVDTDMPFDPTSIPGPSGIVYPQPKRPDSSQLAPVPAPVPEPHASPVSNGPAPPPRPTRLYVATPAYGSMVTNAYATSILGLQVECMRRGIELQVDLLGQESLVQRARNILTARFLASGFDALLFLDADLAFSAKMVIDRLLNFHDKDAIVTGVYAKKAYMWTTLREKIKSGDTEPVHMAGLDFNINIPGTTAEVKDGYIEVLDSATGAMLLPRRVVERICERYKDELTCVNDIEGSRQAVPTYCAIFDCMIDSTTRRALSEDYSLCRRFQDMGGKIYVDLTSAMCHVATNFAFTGDVRERFRVTVSA